MYQINFNSNTISTLESEDQAIGLALTLHQASNISHTIVVQKDEKDILIVNKYV